MDLVKGVSGGSPTASGRGGAALVGKADALRGKTEENLLKYKYMKDKRLSILINRPVSEVFEFTVNPVNTSKWIDGIVVEETNETPPKLGTIYRNKTQDGTWNEYEMTEFETDKTFTLTRLNGNYHVRYIFKPTSNGSCDFEYYEWVDDGELDDVFSQEVLEKLKSILEQQR